MNISPKNNNKNFSSNNSFNNIIDQLLEKDEFIGSNENMRKSLPSSNMKHLLSKPSRQSKISKDLQFLDIDSLENLLNPENLPSSTLNNLMNPLENFNLVTVQRQTEGCLSTTKGTEGNERNGITKSKKCEIF